MYVCTCAQRANQDGRRFRNGDVSLPGDCGLQKAAARLRCGKRRDQEITLRIRYFDRASTTPRVTSRRRAPRRQSRSLTRSLARSRLLSLARIRSLFRLSRRDSLFSRVHAYSRTARAIRAIRTRGTSVSLSPCPLLPSFSSPVDLSPFLPSSRSCLFLAPFRSSPPRFDNLVAVLDVDTG